LECCGQYRPADVALERSGDLDDPSYIDGLPADHHLRASENVYAFSANLASMEVLQFLLMVIAPLGFSDVGEWNFHFVSGRMDVSEAMGCESYCTQQTVIGHGDLAAAPTGSHAAAAAERAHRVSLHVQRSRPIVAWARRAANNLERDLSRKLTELLK
jgi:hypothetical protein